MSAQPTDNQNQGGPVSILQDSSPPLAEGRVVEVESASSQSIPPPPTLSFGPTAGLGGGLAQSSSAIPELAMAISSSIMSMFHQMQQNATPSRNATPVPAPANVDPSDGAQQSCSGTQARKDGGRKDGGRQNAGDRNRDVESSESESQSGEEDDDDEQDHTRLRSVVIARRSDDELSVLADDDEDISSMARALVQTSKGKAPMTAARTSNKFEFWQKRTEEDFADPQEFGPNVSEGLANATLTMWSKPLDKEKMKAKLDNYKIPLNCEKLKELPVNAAVWEGAKKKFFSSNLFSLDIKMQFIQKYIARSASAVLQAAQKVTSLAEAGSAPSTEEWSEVMDHLFNAVLFAGQNTQYVTEFRRKSFNKGALAKDVPPDSSQLFGDDLAERLDAIDKAKKLVKSLEPAKSNNSKKRFVKKPSSQAKKKTKGDHEDDLSYQSSDSEDDDVFEPETRRRFDRLRNSKASSTSSKSSKSNSKNSKTSQKSRGGKRSGANKSKPKKK